jgi:hypothetical protein
VRPQVYPALEAHYQAMDLLPLRTLCAFCEWEYTGTALEARQEAYRHRSEHHPERRNTLRKQSNLRSFRQVRMSAEQKAEIDGARTKRVRLLGLDVVE